LVDAFFDLLTAVLVFFRKQELSELVYVSRIELVVAVSGGTSASMTYAQAARAAAVAKHLHNSLLMLFVQVSQGIGHAIIVTPMFNGRYAEHRRRAVCAFPSCAERILVFHGDIVFLERVPHRPDDFSLPVGKREEIEFHLVTTLDAEPDQQEQQHDRKDEDKMIDSAWVE
jgi:hypothetical protein